jgi:hypothetical protein
MFALSNDVDILFEIMPYYRFYFGNAMANMPYSWFYFGHATANYFFIELNAAMVSFKNDDDYGYMSGTSQRRQTLDLGLGFAIGYKYIQEKGIIGEIYFGLGRTMGDGIYPRMGISIGKQF